MIMLALGILGLFLLAQFKRIEYLSEKQTNMIISRITTDEITEKLLNTINELWNQREADIYRLFEQISLNPSVKDETSLIKFLDDTFHDITTGDFLGTKYVKPWDFTLTAVNFNGDFIYHPAQYFISTRAANRYPYEEVFKLRNGNFIWINDDRSNQFRTIFPRWLKSVRFTKLHFREYAKLKSIVVFESHINIIHQLLQVDIKNEINKSVKTPIVKPKFSKPYDFKIIEAIYASKHKQVDVTDMLIEQIRDNTLSFVVSNQLADDPDPGYVKKLKIKYIVDDEEMTSIFKEGEHVQLP